MRTEIPLDHILEGRWLTRVQSDGYAIYLSERSGWVEFVHGWISIVMGTALLVVSAAGIYSTWAGQPAYPAAMMCLIAPFIIDRGLSGAFPRKGFSIGNDRKIRVWELRLFRKKGADFDPARFVSVRVSQHLSTHYYEVSLLKENGEVLLLAKPRVESDATALAVEVSRLLNLPMREWVRAGGIDPHG